MTFQASDVQVSWDSYDKGKPQGTAKPFPPKGDYVFQAPFVIGDEAFKVGSEGQTQAQIDPITIVGGALMRTGSVMRRAGALVALGETHYDIRGTAIRACLRRY